MSKKLDTALTVASIIFMGIVLYFVLIPIAIDWFRDPKPKEYIIPEWVRNLPATTSIPGQYIQFKCEQVTVALHSALVETTATTTISVKKLDNGCLEVTSYKIITEKAL